jgi:hypothetical protein
LTTETYILLEGELRVYGLDDELLAVMTKGSHFGLDLSDNFTERTIICSYDEKVRTAFKMDFASDNFDNRPIVHLVADSIVTLGVLKQENRERLYSAFTSFKQRMQFINRVLFQLAKVRLEKLAEKD